MAAVIDENLRNLRAVKKEKRKYRGWVHTLKGMNAIVYGGITGQQRSPIGTHTVEENNKEQSSLPF